MTAKASAHKAVCFDPLAGKRPHTLILGSMPGVRSLEEQQYYAHPQNSFWKIMGGLFHAPINTYEQRVSLIEDNSLALWDVLQCCARQGSLDSKIDPATIEVNDFSTFLKKHTAITRIFFNGATAEKEFTRHVWPSLPSSLRARLSLKRLPSTSPAHAGLRIEKKIKEWSVLAKGKG
jgi:TDG/mug DNA glycosylase family protein